MRLYSIGNHILESDVPFPDLTEIRQGTPQYSFRLLAQSPKNDALDWFHHWTGADEEVWLAIGRHASGYLLRFPDLADFHLSTCSKQIDCYVTPGTSLETISHLLLDQVFPLVLSKNGRLVVHASAVVTPKGALAFVGSTGRGKSTLAASLAVQGFPLMTDDCLLIEETPAGLMVTSSYPGARLWDDSIENLFEHEPQLSNVAHYTDKKRLTLSDAQVHFCWDTVPLRRMYFLADPADTMDEQAIAIMPLTVRETFMELVAHAYKLDIDERQVLEREFRRLNTISTLPLFYRLRYRHDYALLPELHAAILGHALENQQ